MKKKEEYPKLLRISHGRETRSFGHTKLFVTEENPKEFLVEEIAALGEVIGMCVIKSVSKSRAFLEEMYLMTRGNRD